MSAYMSRVMSRWFGWAGFRFFPGETEKLDGGKMQEFTQYLREQRGDLKPTTKASKIPKGTLKAGLLLHVTEFRNLPPERRETPAGRKLPPAFGDVYCILIATNYRAIK